MTDNTAGSTHSTASVDLRTTIVVSAQTLVFVFVCCLTTNIQLGRSVAGCYLVIMFVLEWQRLTEREWLFACLQCMIESALQHLMWPVCSVAELQLMNSVFVSVHTVFFRAHCSTQEVTISVISGSSLSLLGVSQQPDAVSTEADLCRGHCWWGFKMFRPIYAFHSFLIRLGFPLSRHVNASSADISCLTSVASLGAVGQGLGEERKRSKRGGERGRKRGGKTDGLVSSLRWHGDERKKIWKIKIEVCSSCQRAGNHAFISWNIESMKEWKNQLDVVYLFPPQKDFIALLHWALCSLLSAVLPFLAITASFKWLYLTKCAAEWLT